MENEFEKLNKIDVNQKTEKKNGLTYLSWAWAWSELKKIYPEATYTIKKFGENNLPYVYDENTGYMVFTEVKINDLIHEMWLPVMDGANKAMKNKEYKYTVKDYYTKQPIEKTVYPATMFDINKTIMRCLTKNLAMFGLGLYIYAGEDLPENEENEKNENVSQKTNEPKKEIDINGIKFEMELCKDAEELKVYWNNLSLEEKTNPEIIKIKNNLKTNLK